MTTPGKPVIGAGVLRYPQIMSPNFDLADPLASPDPSWAILQNGNAYFFGVTLTGGSVVVSGAGGVFVYMGTPAAGNQPIAWISQAAEDPFGNVLPVSGGVFSQNNGFWSGLLNGTVALSAPGNFTQAAISAALGKLDLQSPVESAADVPANLELASETATGSVPQARVIAGTLFLAGGGASVTGGTTTDTLTVTGATVLAGKVTATGGTAAAPSLVTTDAWHPVSPVPLVTGYTVNQCRYRLSVENFTLFDLQLTGNPTGTSGVYTLTTTLPAQYQPAGAGARSYPLGYNGVITAGQNAGSILIDEAGSAAAGRVRVQIPGVAGTLGTTAVIPLD